MSGKDALRCSEGHRADADRAGARGNGVDLTRMCCRMAREQCVGATRSQHGRHVNSSKPRSRASIACTTFYGGGRQTNPTARLNGRTSDGRGFLSRATAEVRDQVRRGAKMMDRLPPLPNRESDDRNLASNSYLRQVLFGLARAQPEARPIACDAATLGRPNLQAQDA